MAVPFATSREEGALLLADISGYTSFLQGVADAHRALIIESPKPPAAYEVVSSLLEVMVEAITPTFRLAKLEGDAVFAIADDRQMPHGPSVMACLRGCYAAFRTHLEEAKSVWTCTCDGCSRLAFLDLKFILHHGEYVVHRVAGTEDVMGPQVNIAHRLLKNHARDLVGDRPYALLSEAAIEALQVPHEGWQATVEQYDDTPDIPVRILALA